MPRGRFVWANVTVPPAAVDCDVVRVTVKVDTVANAALVERWMINRVSLLELSVQLRLIRARVALVANVVAVKFKGAAGAGGTTRVAVFE